MKSRALRMAVFLVAVAAVAAAAWRLTVVERAIADERDAAAAFDRQAQTLIIHTWELRAAERGYVAEGQGQAFWSNQVTTLLQAFKQAASAIAGQLTAPEAQHALTSVNEIVDSFGRLDVRVKADVAAGQRLMASDLIFADGLEMLSAAAAGIEDMRARELAARAGAIERRHLEQVGWLATAAAIVFLALLLLLPRAARPVAASDRPPITPGPTLLDQAAPTSIAAPATASVVPPPAPADAFPSPDNIGSAELEAAAQICTDLARLEQSTGLPQLLERAAALLDASGIIVWVADRDNATLRPVLSHGYPPQALSRIGGIARDADNATAAAFRRGELMTVAGDAMSSGAIVAPLATPSGCAGVVAVETRRGRETSPAVQSLVSIFAAQLATLVAAPDTAPRGTPQEQ